jgi:hypothetical protein
MMSTGRDRAAVVPRRPRRTGSRRHHRRQTAGPGPGGERCPMIRGHDGAQRSRRSRSRMLLWSAIVSDGADDLHGCRHRRRPVGDAVTASLPGIVAWRHRLTSSPGSLTRREHDRRRSQALPPRGRQHLHARAATPRRALFVREIRDRMPGDAGGSADAGCPDDDHHSRPGHQRAPCGRTRKPLENSRKRALGPAPTTADRRAGALHEWTRRQRARPTRNTAGRRPGAAEAPTTRDAAGRQSQKNGLQTRIFVTHRAQMR